MIRRITKNNDLKDIIRSIPSEVINNIEQVRYYVYGYEDKFIAPEFTQEGDILKVIIPAEDLATLPDGLLYRQCFYNKDDVDYPDGVYNLSITDNLELWIYSKENSVQPPIGSNYLQEDDLKTINGESLVGKGDIVIQTTAANIECDPVSGGLFNFSNVNDGLIQITNTVEEINNSKEDKKPVFYIDVNFDGPAVLTSYNDYLTIGAQIKQLGADNVVLYIRDRSGYICIPDVIEAVSQNYMTITGMAYTNNYRIYNNSSSLFIYFDSFVGYTQLNNKINDVKTWVVNQNYAKKTELKTINGQSIVGSGDITIQATGGVTEEWLQNNLKTINGQSLIGGGDLAVQSPIEIGIEIDSGQLVITYDEYKAMIDEYTADGGFTKKLMIFLESETAGRGYSSYPSDVEYCPDGTIEIGGYFLDDRDENDKKLVYYRIKGNDATQKIELTLTPIPSNADIPDLTGYATETWVESKGYLTEHQSLENYALKTEIPDVSGYALKTEIPSLTGYVQESNLKTINGNSLVGSGDIVIQGTGGVTEEWVTSQGYATETWVSNQGYLTEHQSLADYALKSEIPDVSGFALKTEIPSLTGYATETWVESKGYALQSEIPDMSGYALKSEIPSLTGYATESWVTNQGYTTQTYVDNKIGQIDTLLDQMLG